jgi:hypothetical protein
MDWQFKVGIGFTVVFGLLPFAVKEMPHWVTWPGLTIGGLFILWGFLPRHDEFPLVPTLLFTLLVGGAAGCVAWGYGLLPQSEKIASNIAVGCRSELLPKTFGPNESVRVLNLFPTPVENGGGGLAYLSNSGGKEWQWRIDDNTFPGDVTKCEITNYGSVPIFDFKMLLDLTFIEAVDVPEQKMQRNKEQSNSGEIGLSMLKR